MRRDIDTALLRAFVAVVETGSVTGAAALLNLTQAAVSQQLKRLEELFGTQLFERHHRRLALRPTRRSPKRASSSTATLTSRRIPASAFRATAISS